MTEYLCLPLLEYDISGGAALSKTQILVAFLDNANFIVDYMLYCEYIYLEKTFNASLNSCVNIINFATLI